MSKSTRIYNRYTLIPTTMSDRDIAEMQQRIDEGIVLAQERLVERSRLFDSTLVVARNGQVMEIHPDDV